jgi:hypothetical protein
VAAADVEAFVTVFVTIDARRDDDIIAAGFQFVDQALCGGEFGRELNVI